MKKTNHHWEMCICSKKHVTSSTKSYPSLAPKLTPSPLGNKLHSDTGWSVCRGDIAATCWSCSAPFSSSSPTDTGVIENTCTRCSATCKIKYQRQRASAVLESCNAVKWNHQGHPRHLSGSQGKWNKMGVLPQKGSILRVFTFLSAATQNSVWQPDGTRSCKDGSECADWAGQRS